MKRILVAIIALTASLSHAAIPGTDALANLIMKQFDTNSDKLIDAGEWQNGISTSFENLDSNGDGSITAEEIDGIKSEIANETGDLASGLVVGIIKQIIFTLDKDGDKAVSRKEYTEHSAAFFTKLDADSNGSLTQAELAELPVKLLTK